MQFISKNKSGQINKKKLLKRKQIISNYMHNTDIKLQFKQTQQLLLSLSMQKALFVLQLPVLELKDWLEEELSLNPVLERKTEENEVALDGSYIERKGSSSHKRREQGSVLYEGEDTVEHRVSLFTHLMNQAILRTLHR